MKRIITLLLLINCANTAVFSQATWLTMGSGLGSSSETVKAFAENPITHEIFAGGTFTSPVAYLAKWNPATPPNGAWEAVGSGVNGPVNSIVFKNSDMYVGGSFSTAGGVSVNNIAKCNNGNWSDVGGGLNGQVNCLYVSGSGTLYAGGSFSLSGSTTMNHISKLVSTTWTAIGSGVNSVVNAIVEYNGGVYAGCQNGISPLQKYTTSDWAPESSISGGNIYALATFSNNLYVGGDFSTPSRAAVKFDGSNWGTIVTQFSFGDKINAFLSRGNTVLYIAGKFQNLGIPGNTASYIARINSPTTPIQSITAQSSTISGEVYAIGNQAGRVIAGGQFATPSSNAAITSTTIDVNEISNIVVSRNIFPNPAYGKTHIKIDTKQNLKKPEIKIFNIQSQLIPDLNIEMTNENNQVEFVVDCGNLPAGNYYYLVSDESINIATDNFVIQ